MSPLIKMLGLSDDDLTQLAELGKAVQSVPEELRLIKLQLAELQDSIDDLTDHILDDNDK